MSWNAMPRLEGKVFTACVHSTYCTSVPMASNHTQGGVVLV
jgi:hypothetical protein